MRRLLLDWARESEETAKKVGQRAAKEVRRSSAAQQGVGQQIVHYLRETIARLSHLPLARNLGRDAKQLYETLRAQEQQVDRVVRWQVNHWLTRRSPRRQMVSVKGALKKLDLRRLPVATARS